MTEIQTSEKQSGTEAIRGWLESTVRALVDAPDAVSVGAVDGDRTTILEVEVAPPDVRRIVGRKGRTADAIRSILLGIGGKAQRRFVLAISEPNERQTELPGAAGLAVPVQVERRAVGPFRLGVEHGD